MMDETQEINCKAELEYYIYDYYETANISALEHIEGIQMQKFPNKYQDKEFYKYRCRIALGTFPINDIDESLMDTGLLKNRVAEIEELLNNEEISRFLILHVNTTDLLDILISPGMMNLLHINNIDLNLKIHDKMRF